MLVCAFLCASLHTRPRVQRAPGLPCALLLLAGERFASLGQTLSRECGVISRRHCEPTGRANARPMTGSAKQSRATSEDWIASSAEFIIGLAEGETRWLLAMT